MPEFIDTVFAKTSPKRSFSVIENERFGLVFAKTRSLNSGTEPIFLDDFMAIYPRYTRGIPRIFLFLDDFVNTPGKVANPSGTLGCFIPKVDPGDFKRPWGKTSQQCIIIFIILY